MASSSNKEEDHEDLSSEYEKQRMSFIADLQRFNENRGTPFDRIPEIGGRQIDLYHLYQKVTGLGGRQKVNNEQLWDDFQEEFNLPRACVNSAQALKNIYFRFLNLYEKVNFLGEDPDVKNNEEEDAPARKKICLPIDSIPLCYNYSQHKLTDALRQQHSLSTDLYSQSEYEKLLMSLRSGLPNEVDLAVNVCVLLSTEGKHCIKLEKCPQLLHLLLAHVGVFEDSDEMQDLYQHCWLPYTKRNFLRFWYETVDSADVRSLITWQGKMYIQRDLVGSEVLNLGRDLGISDVEGHRVVQVAVFLHNLSFEEDNQKILASSYLVFKFVMLSLHSTYGGLRQLALDTFANLSCELALDTIKGVNCRLVLNLLNTALFSEDRFFLVRGLEILSKMSQVSSSESIMVEQLREDIYKRLVDLLTVQDIQLIVHTLEALYKLSKIGEPFTTRIARVHRAVDTLVSLITIEAQSFGPGSLVGIKVVEYVPPTHVSSEEGENLRRPTTVIQSINPDSVNIYQVPANSQGQLSGVPDTGGGKGPGGGGETQKAVALDKEKEVTDIQATTTSWLNATFELKKKSKVNQVELFSEYLQFCRKFGISNALSSADFLQLVKATFHQCEVLSINRKNGDRDVYFEGLCKRPAQKPFAVTTLPSEKVRKPLCVNVSPKQTPCQVLDPLAHTPTLRQRLMEPPRVSIHPQLPHTGALSPTVSSASIQAAAKNRSHPNLPSTPVGPRKMVGVLHTKVAQGHRAQAGTAAAAKRAGSASNPSGTDSLSLNPVVIGGQQLTVLKAQNPTNTLHNMNSGTAHSFPSITHALQAEQVSRPDSTDLLSVKSLLAKKLSHAIPEQDSANSPGTNYHSSGMGNLQPGVSASSANISVQMSQANVIVSSTAGSMGGSSSQATAYQHYHPVSLSCVVSSAPTVVASSAAVSMSPMKLTQSFTTSDIMNPSGQNSISLMQAAQNNTSLNQLTVNPSAIENSLNNSAVQQSLNLNNVITHHSNISSSSVVQNPVVSFIQRNSNSYIQNAQISVVQQKALHPSGSQHGNISIVPQQQNSVGVHLVQQGSAAETVMPQNSVTIVQQQNVAAAQNTSNIPCAILPKSAGHQQSNSMTAGAVTSQCSTFSPTQLTSATVNHSIRNQSTVLVANHQAGRTLNSSNAITLSAATAPVQGASVTQPVSSSAVAALLTTSSSSGSQMIISTPVMAGQVQRPQAVSGQAPTTVVIQTPPGTIVMPSRQVVVQGSGSTAFGSVQQGRPSGTVSFIVPSQYRPGSSVTVQGLNFIQQQGSVNMMPSLALANSTAQSQTQNIIQAAQTQQNLMQAAQNQQNLIQAGTRQIVLASGQTKTLPVGVQISSLPGNFVRNTSNLCMAPQEQQPQQNIIIQSSSIQPLPQTMSAASGVTMNMSQGQPSITSVQLPLHSAESQPVRSELHLNSQQPQQQQPQQQMVSQTLNISPLVVMDTQQQQSLLSNQCNGLSHDVNGILGSPESVGSDFPPSPLSFGLVSDKDMLNGKLIEVDRDTLVKKHDIEKVGEKIKMNGYVHALDNSTLDLLKPGQSESQSARVLSHGLNAESQGVIVNGCVPGVIQGAHSVGHRMNIPAAQAVANAGINNGGIIQIQAHAGHIVQQHAVPQQVVTGAGQQVTASLNQKVVGFVQQQQQLQFQPQQLHLHLQQQHLTVSQQPTQQLHIQPHQQIIQHQQQQQHTQVQMHTQQIHTQFQPGQRLQLQRPQQPGGANAQQLSNIQLQSRNIQQSAQLRPRISTLPCHPSGPQGGLNRPVLSRDISGDSDISSDSVASMTDSDKPAVNGQATQTLIVTPATSKTKLKPKRMEGTPVTEKLLPKARSKKKGSTEEGSITVQVMPQNYVQKHIQMEYMCEWTNCRRCFSSARLVFMHVFKQHLPKTAESSCQWASCEKLVRKRWSLVSHMQDHHCSESAMRAAFQRRLASAQQQTNVSTPAPHQPMIYPPDAAMQAIRRFSIKQPYAEFAEQREGPVSKHIRLTAALILRNICHFSSVGRRLVKRHEQDLSYNMMSSVEASTALSHCLWEIVHCCEQSSGPLKI